ncbi:MAG: class I adenylate cyclase [Pasteurellaceae bacterium]|nr:class I adenylate cyclase [Pasteurellaceae bacterium]
MRVLNLTTHSHSMNSPTVSLLDINTAKSRIDQLERLRIQRALNNSSEAFRRVFALLPALLHYNDVKLIGYTPRAPQGIFHYHPDSTTQGYLLERLSMPLSPVADYQFDALYVMGSVGSVTQNSFSDLDLWLCHSTCFSEEQLQALDEKLAKIKKWSSQQGVELNFYLMNPEAFQAQQYNSEVTAEHSGSAQHYVLLDEFYRSAIRLAGKRILWLHILEQGQSYRECVNQAISQQVIDPNEWLDFGDFSTLPLGEYFGASLWQLYKGIENPYKSAIKILLLESYAETYPDAYLISQEFKQRLLGHATPYHFDPYLAMLERVTAYLEKRGEFKRLECLRACFYVKAMDGQSDDWKRQQLKALAASWGWSEKECAVLENKPNWKIKQAMRHQQMLVEQLLQSYRNLINFARKFHIDPSIMPQDTDILMRKLYSVFEVLPGKVTLINEKIAQHLEEPEVTFVEVVDNVSTKAGWYLINHAPLSYYDSNKRYVQYQKSLNKLVAWAYFNGVVTVNTRLNIVSQTVSLQRLRHFITDLRLSFPAKSPQMSDDDLYHPNEIRNLIVAVNLTQDPTKKLAHKQTLSHIDLFNLNSSEQGIIGSISLIYRNMWNEIMTQHIEGADSILKALKFLSNKIYRSSAPPQSVNVFCYSAQLAKELQKFVMELVNRCISVQLGTVSQKQSHTFKLAGKKWQLVFNQGVALQEVPFSHPLVDPSCQLNVPKEIYNFASEGFLQFFFEDNADGQHFNVYVLDKQNKVEIYAGCTGCKENKIKKISRVYAENEEEPARDSFNYPQFYQLLKQGDEITIVPFQSRQHRLYLDNLR